MIKQTGSTYASLVSVSEAEARALEQMAACSEWVMGARKTGGRAGSAATVHGPTAMRLVRKGLAKVKLRKVGRGSYKVYTITRSGMKAIGWQGKTLR